MRRGILFKVSVTFVLCVAFLLFYLVNVQVSNYESSTHRQIFVRGMQDHQLFIINKKEIDELTQTIYEQDHLAFESEVDIGRGARVSKDEEYGLPRERFESRQLSVKMEPEQEFYYDNSIPDAEEKRGRARFTEANLTPVISREVATPRKRVVHLCVVVCEDRATEALTMLKSAAMVTKNVSIVLHIIADEPRQKIIQEQLETWPKEYSLHISYYIYNVTYFEGTAWNTWKSLYKPCAVQRLFLPDRLLNVDSLIYVDTDTIFLKSLDYLWNHFELFNSTQLISLVKESEDGTAGWYNRFASHPYYGEFGVNSGVMLMNLTRLRTTNWLSEMQTIYQKYRLQITWGDQDLINIYFSFHPEQLFIMPCAWNYRTDHCMYVSNCKSAEQTGVSLLHGSRGSFYQDKEPAFHAIHQAFQKYTLGDSLKLQFLPDLHQRLKQASASNCLNVRHIFLNHLIVLARNEQSTGANVIPSIEVREQWSSDNAISDRKRGSSNTAQTRQGAGSSIPGMLKTKLGSMGYGRSGHSLGNMLSMDALKHPVIPKSLSSKAKNGKDNDTEEEKRRRLVFLSRQNGAR